MRPLIALLICVVLSACAIPQKFIQPQYQYPKNSEQANILFNLDSNIEKTTFYIDGKPLATGRRAKLYLDEKEHTIAATPEGYRSKEEFLQPPYRDGQSLSFTFMLGDRTHQKVQEDEGIDVYSGKNEPAPVAAVRPPKITILSPTAQRRIKPLSKETHITVKGQATDARGIASVTVNGRPAALKATGMFSVDVPLQIGENQITVVATNTREVSATEQFTLVRESVQVAKPRLTPSSTPVVSAMASATGSYYALIIGNNDYRHMVKLKTAVNDATSLEKILKNQYGFQTKRLVNATRSEILSGINDFRKRLGENDSLLIYYAGHGEFDKTAGKAYWLPIDAQQDNPAEWIIADDITSSIKRIASKHVLIVSDSCFSGTLTRSAQTHIDDSGERNAFLRKMTERPSRTLMASGGNEPVADGGGTGHSIFADTFIRALNEMESPVFAADELFYKHVKSRVAGKSDQVPEYNEIRNSGHDGGDFVFVKLK